MNFDDFLITCGADNEIDKALWLFQHGEPLPSVSPNLMRRHEIGNVENGQRMHIILTLLRALETNEPVGLHVSIPSKDQPPHCFFLGASINTWAEMPDGERVFFLDRHDAPIFGRLGIHIAGDFDDRAAPVLTPDFDAIWTRREVGEPLRRPQLVMRAPDEETANG